MKRQMQISRQKIRDLIKAECVKAGSQSNLAKRCGISAGYMSQIVNGEREPAEILCYLIGIERVVTYRKIRTDGENR